MPFQTGQSGNDRGRPKLTDDQKAEREQFKGLLKKSTVPALKSIIAIAKNPKNRNCFNACKYIIEKAYGTNNAFLTDDGDEPITIRIVKAGVNGRDMSIDDDDDWN